MNIININQKVNQNTPAIPKALFGKMDWALKNAQVGFSKSVKLAKTLAPILCDTSSNERHLAVINDDNAPMQEKIISIIMLGFPKNRAMLPTLTSTLMNGYDSMRIAAAIAIAQMKNGVQDELLSDILLEGYCLAQAPDVKKAIRQAIVSVMERKSAKIMSILLNEAR